MKKYYRLLDDVNVPNRWHLDDPVIDEGCEPWEFRSGRVFRHHELPPTVEVQVPGVSLDFSLTNGAVPVASPRLMGAIADLCTKDVQRIPVRVASRQGYEILNVITTIQCLDETKSEFLKWKEEDRRPDRTGEYRSVPRLRVDASLVPDHVNFFRVQGWDIALIASEAVAEAFKHTNATGAVFWPVAD